MMNRAISYCGQIYVISAGKVWIFGEDYNWSLSHAIYQNLDDQKDELRLVVARMESIPVLYVEGNIDREIYSFDGKTWIDQPKSGFCRCDLKALITSGCKCGGK